MGEREQADQGNNNLADECLTPESVWEEMVKEDIIWEGGLQSQFLPQRVEPERTGDFQTFHPDLTKFWD